MSEAKTYDGSCHCGNVRYRVTTNLASVISCNCSICSKTGALLTFVAPAQFELLAGDRHQADYQFNRKIIHHLFCTSCGVRSFAHGIGPQGEKMFAINVRCLDGVDLNALDVTSVDGKSL